jgi:hypothetical protein
MIVRKEQMDSLARHQKEQFIRTLEGLLEDSLPEYFLGMPKQECHRLVDRLVEEASQRGLNLQNETANYVQMRIEAGEEFEAALNADPDFRQVMDNREVPSNHKLAMIEQRFFSLK